MTASELELEMAETMLLRGDRITLTGAVVPEHVCQALISRHDAQNPLDSIGVNRLATRHAMAYRAASNQPFSDDDKKNIVVLHGWLTQMPAAKAPNYVAVLIAQKIWFPNRKVGLQLEKMAEERRIKILSSAKAHLVEAQKRAKDQAEQGRITRDRETMTPEQRAAHVARVWGERKHATA